MRMTVIAVIKSECYDIPASLERSELFFSRLTIAGRQIPHLLADFLGPDSWLFVLDSFLFSLFSILFSLFSFLYPHGS